LLVLFLARAFDGLTGGNIAVAQAYLADISTERRRKADYAKLAMATSVAFGVGPAIAGFLAETPMGNKAPVLAAAGVSFLALVFAWWVLPNDETFNLHEEDMQANQKGASEVEPAAVGAREETSQATQTKDNASSDEATDDEEDEPRLGTRGLLAIGPVRFVVVLYFLIYLGFNLFYTAFPLHAAKDLNWDAGELGIFFTVLSVMMALVEGPFMNWLSNTVEDTPLIWIGAAMMAGFFGLLMIEIDWMVYVSSAVFALGNGIMWPSFLSVLSKVAPKGHQGAVQGLGGSAGGFASVAGLILGGMLFDAFRTESFLYSGALFVLVTIMALILPGILKNAPTKLPETAGNS
jgi:MFS family permease